MNRQTRLPRVGVLCVMLITAPFIAWGQSADSPKARSAPEEFQADLERRGFSEQDLRKEISQNLSIQNLEENQVNGRIEVTDAEVSSFYEANKESFNIKETQYRIGQIAVSPNPDAPFANLKNDKARNEDQASKKIQLLARKLEAGEEFQQVAREYSEHPGAVQTGGDFGYHPASALDPLGPDLKISLLALEVGEITPVIRVTDGYMILKLLGKREPGQRELEDPEVQQSIRQEIRNRKLVATQAPAQENLWETYMKAATEAYQQANYAEVEKQLSAALQEAEKFGPEDPRLATSLNNLAVLYNAQGKYVEAEPLHQRALAIVEKALGPEHPNVAESLENYAALLHKMGRNDEAARLEARAQAIREKNAQ